MPRSLSDPDILALIVGFRVLTLTLGQGFRVKGLGSSLGFGGSGFNGYNERPLLKLQGLGFGAGRDRV